MDKFFLITIDTEGDNQWNWVPGKKITTENVLYIPRFQELCEKYGFIPTYLVNYEVVKDNRFVEFAKKGLIDKKLEIGMHLHAWNTPPYYELSADSHQINAPYLIEYPEEIIRSKIKTMTETISDTFQERVVSHRAGRWAMNNLYYKALSDSGYKVDCSVTPHVDWSRNSGFTTLSYGSNYLNYSEVPYIVEDTDVLEVPMTIINTHKLFAPVQKNVKSIAGSLYHAAMGQLVWMRPMFHNTRKMLWLLNHINESPGKDYTMFMLHSSELMPGGSPTFRTNEEIEKLYDDLELLFDMASKSYKGISISDYGLQKRLRIIDEKKY